MDLTKIVVSEIVSVFSVFAQKRKQASTINRSWYGLSFTRDGQITYTQNGKDYVSNEYNAIILPKGQSYTLTDDKEGEFSLINFECDNFLTDTITLIPIKNSDSIFNEFEKLKNLYVHKKNNLILMSSFYSLLYHITSSDVQVSNPLSNVVEYMENNYSQEISNEMLAKKCNISTEHFRKQFAKIYGISPKQYIINVRINMAKQMLLAGNLKINEVAENCGFSNPYHFCRLFKSKTGFTPTEYISKNKIYKI
jgi:AraC-like DNA-binding protein